MAANLRAAFKERQCKHLSDSIAIAYHFAKKSCTEVPHLVPVLDILLVPKPSTDAVGLSRVPDARPSIGKDAYPKRGGVSTVSIPLSDELVDYTTSVPPCAQGPRAPSWKEMIELLKQVPYFTKTKAPSISMGDFFPATKRVTVDLNGDLLISFIVRLPFSNPESVISHIQPMQDYTTAETVEVVSLTPLQLMVP